MPKLTPGCIQTLENPGKRHRSWKTLEKSWNSEVVVVEIVLSGSSNSLEKKFNVIHHVHFVTSWVSSDFGTTFILLLNILCLAFIMFT